MVNLTIKKLIETLPDIERVNKQMYTVDRENPPKKIPSLKEGSMKSLEISTACVGDDDVKTLSK